MRHPTILLTTSSDTFDTIYWKRTPLFEFYPKIKSFLSSKLGDQFDYILARPKAVKSGKETTIRWITEYLSKEAKPLSDFSEEKQTVLLSSNLYPVQAFADSLASASKKDDRDWGELLQLVLSNIAYERVFVENDKIVIAAWGQVPLVIEGSNSISKDKILPPKFEGEAKEMDAEDSDSHASSEERIFEEKQEDNNIDSFQNTLSENTDELVEERDSPNAFTEKSENSSKETISSSTNDDTLPTQNPKNSNHSRRNTINRKWSWLLLLLLIPLAYFLLRGCSATKVLPENSNVLIPIDTTKIIPSEDSIRLIVSDRINVLLKNKEEELTDFAEAFKKSYPDKGYDVIYYDTMLNKLQIRVPSDERERLIEEIPKKLSQFDILVWHESIFKRNQVPSDPGFSNSTQSWYIDPIKVEEAWQVSYGDSQVVVAVIDDGFDLSHPEFLNKIIKPWNVVYNTPNVFTNRTAKHGSHVAGTAVGNRNNDSGLSGIAPDCLLMPIQVGDNNGTISSTAVVDAVLYAINQGADIINLSLGMQVVPPNTPIPVGTQLSIISNTFLQEEAFWKEIFNIAEAQNVLVVMAGGNDNLLIGLDPMQRSSLPIKVSAVGQSLQKADFSNFGRYSTVSAPGVQIYSSVPQDEYTYMSGTSMASPVVAGAAALLKSIEPKLTPTQIREALVTTGRRLSNDIGPLIQLGSAVEYITGEEIEEGTETLPLPDDNCNDVQTKIDSLLQEIERLKNLCPDYEMPEQDTMRMPEEIEDLDFSVGRWKSTTSLRNNSNQEVVIYFDFFANGTGKITLVEPDGTECSATLTLAANRFSFDINQLDLAQCDIDNKSYNPYTFVCQADENGYAHCNAQNKKVRWNNFDFNLIKIR